MREMRRSQQVMFDQQQAHVVAQQQMNTLMFSMIQHLAQQIEVALPQLPIPGAT